MNASKISIKWSRLATSRNKIIFWSILLVLSAWNYYRDFFDSTSALLLAFLITGEILAMLSIGYFSISKTTKFPKFIFWSWTIGFTFLRWAVVFFILQYHLPDWTVFHYPERAVFFLFFTSAAIIFIGYSYSIYEWGLAAKMEFASKAKNFTPEIQHPVQIRSEGKTIRILPHEILFLEAKGEYVLYVTNHSKHMCFQRMKTAQNQLKQYGLVRAHRSYIINPMNTKSYSSNELEMNNGKKIPIGLTYKDELMEVLKVQEK
ncbi:MAG: LytTR family DNA-binding domain-containing protein [Bacteroidota bacterium]